jgi:hypothetical protein
MVTIDDSLQIKIRGIHPEQIKKQLENFEKGFPPLTLIKAATNFHGIKKICECEIQNYISVFEQKKSENLEIIKFVPASGAATRMFGFLYTVLDQLQRGKDLPGILVHENVHKFLDNIERFAFFDELKKQLPFEIRPIDNQKVECLLETLLTSKGMNYGNLPKALLKFHKYPDQVRTAIEEHLVEGGGYARNSRNEVHLHFTVSADHLQLVEYLVQKITSDYQKKLGVNFFIDFSTQKASTDTLAVNMNNEPLRDDAGKLLFRPAGHGALLENLNDLDADLIFIKNIDNVVPDGSKKNTSDYKKVLAGILLSVQKQLFKYQKLLDENAPENLENSFYAEVISFLETVMYVSLPQKLFRSTKEELYYFIRRKIFRPIRVCGMVKNSGEPGGGPFFAANNDGTVSLQIVESSQVDHTNSAQVDIFRQSTHFNPVDLVCGTRNHKGVKFNLLDFTDPQTGFITKKTNNGKELKAQELPGLWNGSMSDWNTLFAEVPAETFCPVKIVNDLLRKEHCVE